MKDIDFGNYLSKLRMDNKLTQRFVAYQLEVTDKAVSKWEMGKSKPDLDKLRKLACLYNVDVNDLINYDSNNKEDKNFSFDYLIWAENFNKRETEFKKYLTCSETFKKESSTLFPSNEVEHAIKVGSLCHKLLQNIFNRTTVNFDNEGDTAAVTEAREIINKFLKSPVYKELEDMEFLASEFPVTVIENGLIKNGIIDALFKTKEGNIRIIDFKSDKINVVTDKTVEPNYLKQIAFYKNALKGKNKGEI